ncbi:MAG: hypothetical protein WCX65_06260 [bacterium]
MKRIAVFCLLASALFINLNILAAKAADGRPPAIEEGWNLFSVPCDVELSALQAKLGDTALEVYEWSGTDYTAAGSLKRGYGYIIKSGREVKDMGVCDGKTDSLPVSIGLKKGWNLMGNPNATSLSFADAFKENASSIADLMFKIEDGRYKPILKTDNIDAWKAIWVYSFKDIELSLGTGCSSLKIEFEGPQKWTIEIGSTVKFKASCFQNGTAIDVTNRGTWYASDSNVLKPGDEKGEFKAVKFIPYEIAISFVLNNSYSNRININVTRGNLKSIQLSLEKTELKIGETTPVVVIGTFLSGATDTLKMCNYRINYSNDNCFQTDYRDAGEINYKDYDFHGNYPKTPVEKYVYYAMQIGENCISVRVDEYNKNSIISNKVCVKATMTDALLDDIYINLSQHRTLFPGNSVTMKATGKFGFGEADVTKLVEWNYDKEAGALDDKYVFHPSKAGEVGFTAKMNGITSKTIALNVIQKQLVSMSFNTNNLSHFSCNYPQIGYYVFVGKSAKISVLGNYNDYITEDVANKIENWEAEDGSILKAEGDAITALSAGRTRIRASVGGFWTDWLEMYAVDENSSYLFLSDLSKYSPAKAGNSIGLSGAVMLASGFKKATSGSYYDSYRCKDVTADSKYSFNDTNIAEITGVIFKGKSYGTAVITAQYKDMTSNSASIEVWNPVNLNYCNPDKKNEAMWKRSDYIVFLSTDCDSYENNTPVAINLSMQMIEDRQWAPGYCAELYIYNSAQELVKTLKGGRCGNESLFRTVAGYKPFYEYNITWDRRDETGKPVPPGEYYAVSRFAVNVDPVVKVKFAIK